MNDINEFITLPGNVQTCCFICNRQEIFVHMCHHVPEMLGKCHDSYFKQHEKQGFGCVVMNGDYSAVIVGIDRPKLIKYINKDGTVVNYEATTI